MDLGVCTIQRDRGQWLEEWLAFHYVVGFRKFYYYAHLCSDQTHEKLQRCSQILDIKTHILTDEMDYIQLKAYQHCYDTYGGEVDWLAFLDGDEFLFPTCDDTIQQVLSKFDRPDLSALAAYWVCFGSNGHIQEPQGLLIDNYRTRPEINQVGKKGSRFNRHVKSIVKSGQSLRAVHNAHFFATDHGTYDTLMRPITHGYQPDYEPTYDAMRINHYILQSFDYFHGKKKNYGMADQLSAARRPDEMFENRDFNDVYDDSILRFRQALIEKVAELKAL